MLLGHTALDLAVEFGHTETVEVLKKYGEPYLNFFLIALKLKAMMGVLFQKFLPNTSRMIKI